MKTTPYILLLIALISLISLDVSSAIADDDLDVQLCATVFPCGLNGEVLPEFKNGVCYPIYKKQCDDLAPQSQSSSIPSVQKQVIQCRLAKRNLKASLHGKDQTIAYLRNKVAQLRVQIEQLKN